MLVDIFMAPVGPSQAPKMEPVVPNVMSASVGSSPAKAGAVVAARAALETTKWRRLSMAFSPCSFGKGYIRREQPKSAALAPCGAAKATNSGLGAFLRQKAGDAGRRRRIKDAIRPQRHAFAGLVVGHEVFQLSGAGAADIDALLAIAVVVAGIERVVGGDEEAAGMVEAAIFGQPLAVLVEDLDAAIDPVGHQQPALTVEGQRMGIAELALARSQAAPRLDELAIRRELDDAGDGV